MANSGGGGIDGGAGNRLPTSYTFFNVHNQSFQQTFAVCACITRMNGLCMDELRLACAGAWGGMRARAHPEDGHTQKTSIHFSCG